MDKRFGLKTHCIKDIISVIKLHPEVEEALIFGSRAMGTYKNGSDIDIALKGENINFDTISTIRLRLDELPYLYMYDIIDCKKVSNPAVTAHIDELGITFYKKQTMPSEWKSYKLGDLGTLARGKSKHRPRDAAFLYGGKYPFIQKGDIKAANHKISKHTQTYSEDGLKQSKLWDRGTICITIAANIADTAILEYPACFPDSVIGFLPNREMCNVDFMEYQLQYSKRSLQRHSIGLVQDNINLGAFQNFTVNIPNLPTQTDIAQILSSLDNKIELNLQMNQTLEAMAQAIFKEWFVDFKFPSSEHDLKNYKMDKILDDNSESKNPVNQINLTSEHDLKDYKMDKILDDNSESKNPVNQINPNNPVQDNLPKGWRMGKISDLCNVNTNTLSSNENLNEIQYIEISEVEKGLVKNITIYKRGEEPSRAKRKLKHGDVVLSTVRPNRGSYFLAINPASNLIASTGFAVFTATNAPYTFLYCFLTAEKQIEYYGKMANGAAYSAINPSVIMDIDLIIPENRILKQYHEVVEKLYLKVFDNTSQNQILMQTRDTLLPKLMSGQIHLNTI